MNNLLTVQEAADILQVSTETLRRWDNKGKLKAVVINSRGDRRYKKEDIEEFIQKGKK